MPGHPLVAAIYDRMAAVGEKAGMSELREELLAGARGRTLELGAGTGLNLSHYPEAVSELVLTEPDPHMAKRLRRRLSESPPPFPARVIEAAAEQLPFEDASFDTVVSTLVFCTVSDPERAAGEAARVVKRDGELHLVEHVRAEEGSTQARWQDRLERPWGWLVGGCHPNRDTATTLSARFDVSGLRPDALPKAPPIVKPLIRGRARPVVAE
jgi:ubiquinone/menaquinone biosynthesis C-methylase UbiE